MNWRKYLFKRGRETREKSEISQRGSFIRRLLSGIVVAAIFSTMIINMDRFLGEFVGGIANWVVHRVFPKAVTVRSVRVKNRAVVLDCEIGGEKFEAKLKLDSVGIVKDGKKLAEIAADRGTLLSRKLRIGLAGEKLEAVRTGNSFEVSDGQSEPSVLELHRSGLTLHNAERLLRIFKIPQRAREALGGVNIEFRSDESVNLFVKEVRGKFWRVERVNLEVRPVARSGNEVIISVMQSGRRVGSVVVTLGNQLRPRILLAEFAAVEMVISGIPTRFSARVVLNLETMSLTGGLVLDGGALRLNAIAGGSEPSPLSIVLNAVWKNLSLVDEGVRLRMNGRFAVKAKKGAVPKINGLLDVEGGTVKVARKGVRVIGGRIYLLEGWPYLNLRAVHSSSLRESAVNIIGPGEMPLLTVATLPQTDFSKAAAETFFGVSNSSVESQIPSVILGSIASRAMPVKSEAEDASLSLEAIPSVKSPTGMKLRWRADASPSDRVYLSISGGVKESSDLEVRGRVRMPNLSAFELVGNSDGVKVGLSLYRPLFLV